MVYGGPSVGPMRRRWPIGSTPGNLRLASDSLISATQRRAGPVVLVEQPAAPERNAHRLEVARAHGVAERAVTLRRVVGGTRLEVHAVLVEVAAQRQLAGEAPPP